MTSVDELRESWAAEPPAVGRARAAVAAFAREAGASPELLDDVRLAVSEAATNVVLHAYVGSTPGPLHIRARVRDRRLEVEVCDEGGGVRARTDSPGLGIGLSLISTVTDSVEITSPTAQENRVRMLFDLDPSRAPLA